MVDWESEMRAPERRQLKNGEKCLVSAAFLMSPQAAGVPDANRIGGRSQGRLRQQPVKYGVCNVSTVFLLPTTATSHGATVSVTIIQSLKSSLGLAATRA